MTDLTQIDKPFGDLDQQTQWALMGAYQCREAIEQDVCFDQTSPHWAECAHPAWSNCMKYRLKPKPVREKHTFKQWCVSHGEHVGPTLNESIVDVDVIQTEGTTTIETLDGKAVRVVWEAAG